MKMIFAGLLLSLLVVTAKAGYPEEIEHEDLEDEMEDPAEWKFDDEPPKKTCPMYDPPANGALACQDFGSEPACTVSCQRGFDFTSPPPILYLCASGTWQTIGFLPSYPLPWSDCAATANPAQVSMWQFPQFYYDGNCSDPSTQTQIKSNFVSLLTSLRLCIEPYTNEQRCDQNEVTVHCGATSAAARRRRRSTVMQEGLKILVNCIHAKNVSEERCFKDFSDHLKPYPETKPCFEALENCHFSPKAENLICLTDFENCLNKPVD